MSPSDPVKQAWQAHVGENHRHVLSVTAEFRESLLGILAFDNAQVGFFEQRCGQLAHNRIILDDQGGRPCVVELVRCHVTSPLRFFGARGAPRAARGTPRWSIRLSRKGYKGNSHSLTVRVSCVRK